MKKQAAPPQAAPADSAGFETFKAELARLVGRFEQNFKLYQSPTYSEASVRQDFLDPLFAALGWDIGNKRGLIPQHREVEIESRTEISGRQKRADYLFRTDRTDRFVCEAKKPAEELHAAHAFQAKRYAWNKNLVLAVLSDFEEIKIYLVGARPHVDDPDTGHFQTWHYLEYAKHAADIWNLLSHDAVAAGAIEKLVAALPRKPVAKTKAKQQWLFKPDRARAIDADFLDFLDEARRELASDLIRHNDRADLLEGTRLDEAVQRILDRLLFLRICEDRDIDTGRPLANILKSWRDRAENPPPRKLRAPALPLHEAAAEYAAAAKPAPPESLWREIVAHFRALDRRPASHIPYFNGNLFKEHFSETLAVSDEWISGFLDEIGDDESPYLFNVIPVEILGTIYERFLGKTVRPHGRGVTIEEKPEVRKAGGVYYTPRYIVDYIVEQTLGKLLSDKAPADSLKLRVLDPACGSGSFLIRAFERLCEHWLVALTKDEKLRRKTDCWLDPDTGDLHLTSDLKRRILTANIHGVDLDPGAVEVTQLSLYLKMLEGESRTTLARNRELFGSDIPLLPPLQDNIKCGNSLIASDFSLNPDDLVRVRAFDWDEGFREIMKAGGFDVVIGNPPWGADLEPLVRKYLSGKFARVVERMVDSYIYFTDQALCLGKQTGRVGFVIPSTVLNQVDAQPLRKILLGAGLMSVINLGKDIFTKKVLNTTTLVVTAGGKQPSALIVGDLSATPLEQRGAALATLMPIESSAWISQVTGDASNTFFANSDARTSLLLKLRQSLKTLADYTETGIARGISPDIAGAHVLPDRAPELSKIEKSVLTRSISGPRIKRYFTVMPDQWLIYTHKGIIPRSIPHALAHLEQFRKQNTCKEVAEGKHPWWALHRARDPEIFHSPKFIGLTTTKTIELVFDEDKNLVVTDAMYVFRIKSGISPKAAMGILHSKLFVFLYRVSNQGESRVIPQIKAAKLEPLPFPDLSSPASRAMHDKLVALVDKMLLLVPKLRAAKSETERSTLQNAVAATDRAIDALVYELYGLTAEEIALVEGSTKA